MDCICEGNLQTLVSEYFTLMDRWYKDSKGQTYTFYGIVIGSDDYYYGMTAHKDGRNILLSCVGDIENFGFELVENT